jgi:hypothetical protein
MTSLADLLKTAAKGVTVRLDGREWRIYGAHRGRVLLLAVGVPMREVDAATEVEVVSGPTCNGVASDVRPGR